MKAVLQRVFNATVYADGALSGNINEGLYILLGVEKNDNAEDVNLLVEKISKLRIFCDENDKMNLSVMDINAEVLVVSNFTLNANYSHGNRPDYFASAAPQEAEALYELFISLMQKKVKKVATGKFGADMRSELSTNGPVTIVMESSLLKKDKKA